MPQIEVTTWWLEMTARSQLRPAQPARVPVDVVRAEVPNPEFARFLYRAVGGPWYWIGQLHWPRERWLAHLERPEVETWVAWVGGTPAGYAKLGERPGGEVQITAFGLLPQFIGHGIGGHLLTTATMRAWDRHPVQEGGVTTRVWLHTCSLDGPHARANYQARGFRVYDTKTTLEELPATAPTLWTGTQPGAASPASITRAQREVTTWNLEMTAPDQLRPARPARVPVEVVRAEVPNPEFGRFLYRAVGGPWYWTDRLGWTRERWLAHLERPEVETWVALVGGTPAGYAELEEQPGGQVELAYFGLLPQFTGQGIGGHLLTTAVARAWEREVAHPGGRPTRVWVHTCSLDGPHARANYQARGFHVYDTKTTLEELPATAPTLWTGTQPRG